MYLKIINVPLLDYTPPVYICGNRTLAFSYDATVKIHEFELMVEQMQINNTCEFAGFGITKASGNVTNIIDFIYPQTNKILYLSDVGLIKSTVMEFVNKYIDLHTPTLKYISGKIFLCEDNDPVLDCTQDLFTALDSFFKQTINNTSFSAFADMGMFLQKTKIYLKNDFEAVTYLGHMTITSNFFKRLEQIMLSMKTPECDYFLHYHPVLPLEIFGLKNKSLKEKQLWYHQNNMYSKADIIAIRNLGISWFEIRSLGHIFCMDDTKYSTNRVFLMHDNQIYDAI